MRYHVFILIIAISSISVSAGKKSVNLRDSLVQYAKTLMNRPYRSGSKGPNGFDCSGYTSYVYGKFGMPLKASSGSQVSNGQETDMDNLKEGDLVFFKGHNSKASRIGHVGIFLEHNADGSFNFIHSANGGGVRVDNSYAPYYAKRYVTGCCVIPEKKLYTFTPVEVESPDIFGNVQLASTGTTGKTHKVKKGESLYSISREYKVSEDQLKEWNNLNDNKIKPGQTLTIRSGKSGQEKTTPSGAEGTIHVVKKGESLYSISKKYKIPEKELLKVNNNNKNIKPGDKIVIAASGGETAETEKQEQNAGQTETKTITSKQTHKVKPGETLSGIAEKYHTTSAKLRRLNGISGSKIKPGTVLTVQLTEKEVPVKSAKTALAETKAQTESAEKEDATATKTVTSRKTHKVRKGETLSEIAEKYHTTTTKLKQLNGLKTDKLKPGSYLTVQLTEKEVATTEPKIVPQKTKEQPEENVTSRKRHKVRKGETLSSIASKYGVSTSQLKRWNGISKNKVKPGTYLTIRVDETKASEEATSQQKTQAETPAETVRINPAEKTHVVTKGETLYSIAATHHIAALQIMEWNGMQENIVHLGDTLILAPKSTPSKTVVPTTAAEKPVADSSSITNAPVQQDVKPTIYSQSTEKIDTLTTSYTVNKTHIVEEGETLESIADMYGVTSSQIKQWNGISKRRNKLAPGQKLVIQTVQKEYVVVSAKKKRPAKGKGNQQQTGTSEETVETAKPLQTQYMVKKGDNLFTIAKATNLTVDQLKEYNHLTGTDVKENQILNLTSDSTATENKKAQVKKTAASASLSYVVKPGDTLLSIAKAYNISVDELKAANEMSANEVNIGQRLQIPAH